MTWNSIPSFSTDTLIELTGNTQKGARVMVNGSEMPIVNSDRQLLRYFNAALAAGKSGITVTAQT